ncbi:30S ribosomal protein S19 [archaeon]|nr:30S ribosomal protein S19 [archaeon]|tara:strand:- start:155 stop:550 length:396 start_codon:yes stop_codon:yes gene_type:complete
MAKGFRYKGKSFEELKAMNLAELAVIFPARCRRSLKRGLTPQQKKFLEKLEKKELKGDKKPIKTQLRSMIVLPAMVNKTIQIHNGRAYTPIQITQDMLGLRLGDLNLTRTRVAHNAPGVGATRSSSALSVK